MILGFYMLFWVFLRHVKNNRYSNWWHHFYGKHPIISELLSNKSDVVSIEKELRSRHNSKLASFFMIILALYFILYAVL